MVKTKVDEPEMPAESEEPAKPEEPRVAIHLRPGNFINGIPMRDLTARDPGGVADPGEFEGGNDK